MNEDNHLSSTAARKTIYPGINYDAWWDLKQLRDQTNIAADIFEYTHLGKVGIWIFDCSSAHEGLGSDAFNVDNVNVNPGGSSAKLMRPTIISHNNPPPKPGQPDTRGMPQDMVYPVNHPEQKLRSCDWLLVLFQSRCKPWPRRAEVEIGCNA